MWTLLQNDFNLMYFILKIKRMKMLTLVWFDFKPTYEGDHYILYFNSEAIHRIGFVDFSTMIYLHLFLIEYKTLGDAIASVPTNSRLLAPH